MSHFDSHDLAAAAVLAAAHSPQEINSSKLDLSLSASSSSLSSDFSLYSSSSSFSSSSLTVNNEESIDQTEESHNENKTANSIIKSKRRKTVEDDLTEKNKELDTQMISMNSMTLNSDLEIEVASTLVGMKWACK